MTVITVTSRPATILAPGRAAERAVGEVTVSCSSRGRRATLHDGSIYWPGPWNHSPLRTAPTRAASFVHST